MGVIVIRPPRGKEEEGVVVVMVRWRRNIGKVALSDWRRGVRGEGGKHHEM